MGAGPRLTIGLPVYNGENFLAEAIEALLGQTYEDFELLISDNSSSDRTESICRTYAKLDSRVRYVRQERNIGRVPNHNFVIERTTTELFKMAAHDDLYARDLLKRCVDALDEHPEAIVAHSWEARVDEDGKLISALSYSAVADTRRAPDRFRSMLFDGWDDYMYGVIRTSVLRRVHLLGTHHFADRTFNTEFSLHGPFQLVPDWLYFRREHAGRPSDHPDSPSPYTVRTRSAGMDPRRASRLTHPMIRLYSEYVWGYVRAIRTAPLSAGERRECFYHLGRWLVWRFPSVMSRALHAGALHDTINTLGDLPDIDVGAIVARHEWGDAGVVE
jgi:glycosyltransferase involved in cell wall biosynthesis